MKLFKGFEAIKFFEENMIFITHDGYLYYIYDCKYKWWSKHENAGNDHLTVANYTDVSREELINAMQGKFPKSETDFMRLCSPSQLCICDMLDLLTEDYSRFMSDNSISYAVHQLLLESNICFKSFLAIKNLFDSALKLLHSNGKVLDEIKSLSFKMIGRDIFKREIGIVDGHDSSSYFWIMPIRVIDYSDTNAIDNIAEMGSSEISIEENDVNQYLTPFLYKYFDENLEANRKRYDAKGFEWYLTYNFFTFDSIIKILSDIRDTIDALSSGRENEFTAKLKIKRGTATYQLIYSKELNEEQIKEYNDNRPTEDDTEVELIIDFYNRFIYRMEYMLKVGEEKGYNLISFMGP